MLCFMFNEWRTNVTHTEMVEFLRSWPTFNTTLSVLDEGVVKALMEHECANKRRVMFMERLHQRYTKLRAGRERITMLLGGGVL